MRAQRGISYLPQEPSIFRKLTVEENILAVLEPQKISYKAKIKQVRSLMDEFNIAHIREAKGFTPRPLLFYWMNLLPGLTRSLFRTFNPLCRS
jgi:ABC-type proline/glycine betaine transport system ATPase subunit